MGYGPLLRPKPIARASARTCNEPYLLSTPSGPSGHFPRFAEKGKLANRPSLGLHEAFGFRQVGYLPSVGYKFGHWTDTVMVQRSLGPGGTEPPQG